MELNRSKYKKKLENLVGLERINALKKFRIEI